MRLRLANGLLVLAAAVFLGGLAGLVLGSGLASWSELGQALRWYLVSLLGRWPSLAPLLALGLGLGVFLLLTARRNRAAFRAELARQEGPRRLSPERRLARSRRRLEAALLGSRQGAAVALDALLGALVDLEARAVQLARGDLVFGVTALLEDGPHPLASLTEAQVRAVTAQAQLVSGAGEGVDGELELRSPGRADRIRVRCDRDEKGPVLELALLSGASPTPAGRRPLPVLVRMAGTPPVRQPTGEVVTATYAGPDETTDSHSGLLIGLDPSAEHEIAPVVAPAERRPVRGLESWLRLWVSMVTLLVLIAILAPALLWGARRLIGGASTAPWREVDVAIHSRPAAARVLIGGEPHGVTPLRLREPCRGRRLQVNVEARGYLVWQWSGICPLQGELLLDAELQPVR